MKFNQEQYDKLLSISEDNLTFKKSGIGSLIYSSEASKNNLIFLTKGTIRLIDNEKIFKSQTLSLFEAPFFIGFTNLLNLNIKGEVRAKTNCEYYSLNIEDLSEKKFIKIFDLFKNQICNFEISIKSSWYYKYKHILKIIW